MEKFSFWSSLFSNFLNFLAPPFENPAYATGASAIASEIVAGQACGAIIALQVPTSAVKRQIVR